MERLRSMADGRTVVILINELNSIALEALVQVKENILKNKILVCFF